MTENRKNNFLINSFLAISIFSFLYLNFIGVGDTSDFAFSSIETYQNVSDSAFREVKAINSFLTKIIEIITLN